MTIDDAIQYFEGMTKELREVDSAMLDVLYASDDECIEAHKDRCFDLALKHEQIAVWLRDYKRLVTEVPKYDIDELKKLLNNDFGYLDTDSVKILTSNDVNNK